MDVSKAGRKHGPQLRSHLIGTPVPHARHGHPQDHAGPRQVRVIVRPEKVERAVRNKPTFPVPLHAAGIVTLQVLARHFRWLVEEAKRDVVVTAYFVER